MKFRVLIWRGCGYIAIIIGVVINFIIDVIMSHLLLIPGEFDRIAMTQRWSWFLGMFLSGVICWVLGRWLEIREFRQAHIFADKFTGFEGSCVVRHDFLGLPIKWWIVPYSCCAIWFLSRNT